MPITLDGTLGVGTPGITLAGGAITANANQLNSSAEDVNNENRIINGDFGIWQRGTSTGVAGAIAADRWINTFTGGTVTQNKINFAVGSVLGSSTVESVLRQDVSGQTLTSHLAITQQRIEGVGSYAGQTITVLGWAGRASGSGNMVLEGVQNFGTGGSPSATVSGISPTTVTLSGTMQPFAVVMTVPSIVGKTLGTNLNDFFQLNFWLSAGSDYNARTNSLGLQTLSVSFWGIHIRLGTWTAADAALYRPRDPGTEFVMCQRYYEIVTGLNTASFYTAPSTSSEMGVSWVFKVVKRKAPTITANLSVTNSYTDLRSANVQLTTNPPTNTLTQLNLTADAEL